jgi:hypothetical protein
LVVSVRERERGVETIKVKNGRLNRFLLIEETAEVKGNSLCNLNCLINFQNQIIDYPAEVSITITGALVR